MSNLIKALNEGVKLQDLIDSLHLEANYGEGELQDLVQLNYSQIDSPTKDPIADECRGLIINSKTNTIIANPFPRFYNHGQIEAAEIDWGTARVQEKLDGSLCILYYYANFWRVATRGSLSAGGNVGELDRTFKEFFWDIWTRNRYELDFDPCKTYLSELTSPENKIVVSYPNQQLTLLAVRDTQSGQEYPIDRIKTTLPKVKTLGWDSNPDVIKSLLANTSPMKTEGVVFVDANYNRIKIKSDKYILIHKMRSKVTPRGIIELIKANEVDEFLTYFSEYKDEVNSYLNKLDALVLDLHDTYEEIKNIPVQKDFAQKALTHKASCALFAIRSGKDDNFYHFLLHKIHVDKLLSILGHV